MLRTARNIKIGSRLIGLSYTTTTGTPVPSNGLPDFSSYTDNATGDTTGTYAQTFGRVPVIVATPDSDVDANGAMVQIVSSAVTAGRVKTATNAGSGADGGCHALIYGWDNDLTTDAAFMQRCRTTGLAARLEVFTFSAPGTCVEGKSRCSVSAATEVSTITLKRGFARNPVAVAIATTAGNTCNIVSVTYNTIVVNQHDSSGSATTGGFHLFVLGWNYPGVAGLKRSALKCPELKPRILAGIVTGTGTPAATDYSDLGTITDNGTGDYTLTFAKPFLRAPVVVASMSTLGSVAVTASTTTTCRLVCQTHAGAAGDPTSLYVIICGFDYATQLGR